MTRFLPSTWASTKAQVGKLASAHNRFQPDWTTETSRPQIVRACGQCELAMQWVDRLNFSNTWLIYPQAKMTIFSSSKFQDNPVELFYSSWWEYTNFSATYHFRFAGNIWRIFAFGNKGCLKAAEMEKWHVTGGLEPRLIKFKSHNSDR